MPECCPKCTAEKRIRKLIAERDGQNPADIADILTPVKPLPFDREVILAKGQELVKRNQGATVTLEADLPGGWTVKAVTERRKDCSENDCQQLIITAEGPTRPPDAPMGVGASGLISVQGITRNALDTDVRISTDEHALWKKPEEGYHKILLRFLGGCCKYLGGLSSDKCNEEETGIEVGVSSTKGTSNEVLVGTRDLEVMQNRDGINIGFQIASKRVLPQATPPKLDGGWRVKTNKDKPLTLGLMREPLSAEERSSLMRKDRSGNPEQGKGRTSVNMGFKYTNNCDQSMEPKIGE